MNRSATDPNAQASEPSAAQSGGWLAEQQEWLEAFEALLRERGADGARDVLTQLEESLSMTSGAPVRRSLNSLYRNTIDVLDQGEYPGDIEIETRIENIIRWNAVAMVLQAYDSGSGVGGHIATYLSAATMMEVGFNHFFRAASDEYGGDQVARTRFACEIVQAIRDRVGPDFPIIFRFSQWKQQDYSARMCNTPEELEAFLKPLVNAGVDIFHCSTRRFWEKEFEGSDMNLAGWTKKLTAYLDSASKHYL